ncbi:MAG: Gfo/Idh/MocA family oxidoreductase [Sedimentisphaerales bacterium]|nr:Gfo/Idh/MocA family oxidoreductase [Sedimentisphaerales bacterium]
MNKANESISRRRFLKGTTGSLAAFTIVPSFVLGGRAGAAPSDKLNIGIIGVGGRGDASVKGCSGENIIALCDVDRSRMAKTYQAYPAAKAYQDFRKMLDEMDNRLDAVAVCTPDHTHAVAAIDAMRRGKHVYCEKPLAHSIYEIRELMKAAHTYNVVTQLGNQGHSFDSIRTFCEWIWDGAIGNVTEVHAACNANHCRISQLSKRDEVHEVPAELDWDLWLGPVQYRRYNPMYHPGRWRAWMPFGSGTIGDWICHVVDPVFWALDLGAPTSVQADVDDYDPKKHSDTFPIGSVITFQFAVKGKRGPVKLCWYSSQRKIPRPVDLEPGRNVPDTGAIVIGDKGKIKYGSHGASSVRIFPEEKMRAYKLPDPSLPRVKGHHQDWLKAIKTGGRAGSNFDYGGPLTELARLGIIAMLLPGRKLEWDGPNMRFTNCDEANQLINPPSRQGWALS